MSKKKLGETEPKLDSLASANAEPPPLQEDDSTMEVTRSEVMEAKEEVKPEEPKKEEIKPPQNLPARSPIKANEQGFLQADTIEGRYRVAEAMYKGKMVPKSYETAAQVFAAMEYGLQLGLRPMVALQKIAVVNGSPALWGEMPLSMALDKKLLIYHKTFLIDDEYMEICFKNKNLEKQPMAAVAHGIRVGHQEVQERFFTRQMAEAAGLTRKEKTPWGQGYDWRMMMWRAQQQLIKDLVPDAIFGIPMAEHDFNVTIAEAGQVLRDITPNNGEQKQDASKALNQLLKKEKENEKN